MRKVFMQPQTRKDYIEITTLIFLPILLSAINSNWIFTLVTNNMPDPWFYLGYFRYFFKYAPTFPSNINYFVERLTWNLSGYFIYHIVSPLVANYILHLTVYYISIFALYGTLLLTRNKRTAFLSA